VDGLVGPVDGLAGLVHGLSYFFLFFYLINRGGRPTTSVKATINHDLLIEAVSLPASVNFV
jgi:hypothetical protein